MKYSIYINQTKAVEWGINLQEATLIELFSHLPTWAEPEIIEGEIWYFFAKPKILEEAPILSKSGKIDTIYRQTKSLVESGFLNFQKIGKKDYWQLTEKIREWNFKDNSEKNPSELGKKSEQDSEKNPTYNNTPSDKNTKDTTKSPSPSDFINKEDKILSLFEFAKDPDFLEKYKMFVKNRAGTRHKVTEASEVLFFGKLRDIDPRLEKHKKEIAIKMIEKALELNWRTIFPLKEKEIEEYMHKDTIETRKRIEAKETKENEDHKKAEAELKVKLNQYWVNLTDEKRAEIEKEAHDQARAEKPNMEERFLMPLIQVAKKRIIAQRLKNETN